MTRLCSTHLVTSGVLIWWRSLDLDGRELLIIGDMFDTLAAVFAIVRERYAEVSARALMVGG